MKSKYHQFLNSKQASVLPSGFTPEILCSELFEFQADIDRWALERGRAAIFADCGLGKTPMQLQWAESVTRKLNRPVLIHAPLAVSKQTEREGKKFGIPVKVVASDIEVRGFGVYVTNYEKMQHFDPSRFGGVVLDESSILKSFTGATRNMLIERYHDTPMKLACSATPAPNDFMELGNHSEFFNVLTRTEMLSTFFVHDGGDTAKWRLKGHAEEEYWKWICQWAVMIRKPSDLGYSDEGFTLPALNIKHHVVDGRPSEGMLFQVEASTMNERRQARRASLEDRAQMMKEIVAEKPDEPWLIWCDLNDEADLIERLIPGAIQVAGRHTDEQKEDRMIGFSEGRYLKLVSKPSIAGFGMNWQHCWNVGYLGLSDSYEKFYQSIRRSYRFGQLHEVNCHVVTSESEGAVVKNIQRKESDAMKMASEMVTHMSVYNTEAVHRQTIRTADEYKTHSEHGEGWEMHLGDCVENAKSIASDFIDYTIFSPPFASLYTYSASERDLGNSRTDAEFYEHFKFLITEMFRVMKPGRLLSFHCMNIPSMKERDGVIGLKNFRDNLIRMFCGGEVDALVDARRTLARLRLDTSAVDVALESTALHRGGFIYHSEVVIWKDPLIEATRTKAIGLMHKQVTKDSAMSRQGLPDYLVTMRKPGTNQEPISRPDGFTQFVGENEPKAARHRKPLTMNGDTREKADDDPIYSHQVWRRYASPVWMDINQSKTLQKDSAREDKDERHICPLQLEVIERGIELWTNPSDIVWSPFAGIGSEGHVAILKGRRFRGDELKESYFRQAVKNLQGAVKETKREQLF